MAGQEDDCDSLEQILRMIKDDEANRSSISSQTINHASSFGVGRTISTVVDPEFRPPSVIQSPQIQIANQTSVMFNQPYNNANQQPGAGQQTQPMMQNTTTTNSDIIYQSSMPNNMVTPQQMSNSGYTDMSGASYQQMGGQISVRNYANSIVSQSNRSVGPHLSSQLPVSGNLSVPSGTAPFTIQGMPNTFQDMARKQATSGFAPNPNPNPNPTMSIMSTTLFQYGPPVGQEQQRAHGFAPYRGQGPPTTVPHRVVPDKSFNPNPLSISSAPMRPASTGPTMTNTPMGPAPFGPAPLYQPPRITPSNKNSRKEISPPPPPPPPETPEFSANKTSSSLSRASRNPAESRPPNQVPATRPSSSGPSNDRMIYSPLPTTMSPPLDDIVTSNGPSSTDEQPEASMTSSGKIPKVRPAASKGDNYDGMTLLQLKGRYRDYEYDMATNTKRLNNIDRQLADLTRNAKGRNIELDPEFKKMKIEQKNHKEDTQRIKNCLDKIKDKLQTKFNETIRPNQAKSSGRQMSSDRAPSRQRAKMSTTSHKDASAKDSSREATISLYLRDCNTWCERCDYHFDSLKDYCDHLHTRDHKQSMPKCSPWDSSSRSTEKVSLTKTYTYLKSMCQQLSNEMKGDSFDVRDLDRVLNYSIEDRDKVLKTRQLQRDSGSIAREDPLFFYKGYNYLVPTSGFYCKLCSEALCDTQQVEDHMRSFNHNVAYAKNVAADREHEKNFHKKMTKSRQELYGEKPIERLRQSPKKSKNSSAALSGTEHSPSPSQSQSKSDDPIPSTSRTTLTSKHPTVPARINLPIPAPTPIRTTNSVLEFIAPISTLPTNASKSTSINIESRIVGTSASTPNPTPPASTATNTTTTSGHQYKKVTSHIVDNHESLTEKFPNAKPDAPNPPRKLPEKRPVPPDNEPARKKASTEIVPVGNMNRPTSLKRLRKSTRPAKSKAIVESDSDDSDFDADQQRAEQREKRISPVIRDDDDDEQTTVESHDSDVEFLKEVHLDRGDPDSPFPDLELSVTGNVHVNALKDSRLSAKCQVNLKLLRLEDYKDMLLDSASVWARLNQIIAKKEPEEFSKEVRQGIKEPEPTFLDVDGNCVPVEIEDEDQGSQK